MIDVSDPGLVDRFWSKVLKSDGCWTWTASTARGYGQIALGQRGRGIQRAHRVSWVLTFGQIPDGMGVLHTCDNRLCVRPDHLFLGTNTDNMTDKTSKGRQNRGSKIPSAKLTESDVRVIRVRVASGVSLGSVAAEFGVSKATVCLIANRKRWGHVA